MNKNASIICLTETHLNEKVLDDEILKEGWNIARCDRTKRQCGGVLCFVKNELPIGEKFSYSTSVCEILGIYLPSINLVNITVYRPPNSNYEHFNNVIVKIKK